jgi:uncharacterized membrane protein
MIAYIIVFIVSIILLGIADAIWIFGVSSRFSRKDNMEIIDSKHHTSISQILSGLSVYVLISIGIMVFVLPKVLEGEFILSFFYGGLLGVIIYGIYEGTNYFVLDRYSKFLAVLDIGWGGASIAIVSFVSKYLLDKLS